MTSVLWMMGVVYGSLMGLVCGLLITAGVTHAVRRARLERAATRAAALLISEAERFLASEQARPN